MKVFLITLFVCVATITNAQTKKFNWYSAEGLTAIDATPEQRQQVKELYDKYQKQIADVRGNTSLSADEKNEKIKGIYHERGGLYYKIITKEQRAKGVAIIKAEKESM